MLVGVFIPGSKIKKSGQLNLPIPLSDYIADEEHPFCISHGLDGNAEFLGLDIFMRGAGWVPPTYTATQLQRTFRRISNLN